MNAAMPHADAEAAQPVPAWTPAESERALRCVGERFASAAEVAGVVDREFDICGRRVRLRAVSADLMGRLARTFTHLEAAMPAGAPDLTIHLWDSASTVTAPPPIPDVHGEQAPGAFFYYSDARLRVGYQLGTSGDARVLAVYPHAPTPSLSVLDTQRAEGWYWVADVGRIPYWEEANPVRYLLDWWLRDRGMQVVHAAAVGTPQGGVLLVGKSGSGKSTAALSVLGSELGYAGDDYVAVSFDPEPTVHSLYSAGKLMPDHVARLPYLLPALDNSDRLDIEKAIVYVHEHWPEAMTSGFPLRAIVVSRVVAGASRSRVLEASPLTGLAALAPSTVFQLHTRGQDSLARMRELAELVPTRILEVGSDVSSIPDAIAGLLAQLSEEGGR